MRSRVFSEKISDSIIPYRCHLMISMIITKGRILLKTAVVIKSPNSPQCIIIDRISCINSHTSNGLLFQVVRCFQLKDPITVLELEAPNAKMNIEDQIWPFSSSHPSHYLACQRHSQRNRTRPAAFHQVTEVLKQQIFILDLE